MYRHNETDLNYSCVNYLASQWEMPIILTTWRILNMEFKQTKMESIYKSIHIYSCINAYCSPSSLVARSCWPWQLSYNEIFFSLA